MHRIVKVYIQGCISIYKAYSTLGDEKIVMIKNVHLDVTVMVMKVTKVRILSVPLVMEPAPHMQGFRSCCVCVQDSPHSLTGSRVRGLDAADKIQKMWKYETLPRSSAASEYSSQPISADTLYGDLRLCTVL